MAGSVLVTGVSGPLGGRLAAALAGDRTLDRVVGVDVVPPKRPLGGAEFVRADIRNPVIGKVIAMAGVDTVVHTAVVASPLVAGGRSSMKEINVIGTMQLLAACQKAATVQRLVLRSSTAVYGSSARDPALFTEDMEPLSAPTSGYGKDVVEIEGYVRGFARRRPDVAVTTLRFANFLGPGLDTAMSRYFALPVVPTVLGFDARLQFVYLEDGLAALRHAVAVDRPGTYNVAGSGVLMLSQALRRAGRLQVPVPTAAVPMLGQAFRQAGLADFSPEQVRFLTHGRGVDTNRLRRDLGFVPRWSTAAAFDAFIADRRLSAVVPLLSPARLAALQRDLTALLTLGRSRPPARAGADDRA